MIALHRPVELCDCDGAYIRVRTLNEDRLIVMDSNMSPSGSILSKPPELAWTLAIENAVGFTRVSPYALVDITETEMEDPLMHDFQAASDDDILRAAHEDVEHRSGREDRPLEEVVALAEA